MSHHPVRRVLRDCFSRAFRRGGAPPRRGARFSLERLESRLTPAHVTYHGGPTISNVLIEPIFYGSAWTTDKTPDKKSSLESVADKITDFLTFIVDSPYMDDLSQYVKSPRGSVAESESLVGFLPLQDFVSKSLKDVVTQSEVESVVTGQIQAHLVDAPAPNNLYIVFLPPGVELDDGSALGYHGEVGGNYYAAIAYPGTVHHPDGTTSTNGRDGPSDFDSITITTSHELVEAITNPTVGGAGGFSGSIGRTGDSTKNKDPNSLREAYQEVGGFSGGWYDESSVSLRGELDKATTLGGRIVTPAYVNITARNEGEIGDLAEGNVNKEGTGDYGTFDKYRVQYYFENTYVPGIPSFDGSSPAVAHDVNALPSDFVGFSLSGNPLNTNFEVTHIFAPNSGSFSGLIGTFYDGRSSGTTYSASIDWGDGAVSGGAIKLNPKTGLYEVRGTHTYTSPEGTTVRVAVTVTADDGSATRVSSAVSLTADPAPVFKRKVTGPFTLYQGQILGPVDLSATDPNGHTVTYALGAGVPGSVNTQSGVYTWQTSSSTTPGKYTIIVIARDSVNAATATATFVVNVLAAPPHLTGIAGVIRKRRALRSISLGFDEPLDAASVHDLGLYSVFGLVKKHHKTSYSKLVRIKSVSFDGKSHLTINLARPHAGAVQVTVHAGLKATNGASTQSDSMTVVK
jgi:hypothetical protein